MKPAGGLRREGREEIRHNIRRDIVASRAEGQTFCPTALVVARDGSRLYPASRCARDLSRFVMAENSAIACRAFAVSRPALASAVASRRRLRISFSALSVSMEASRT